MVHPNFQHKIWQSEGRRSTTNVHSFAKFTIRQIIMFFKVDQIVKYLISSLSLPHQQALVSVKTSIVHVALRSSNTFSVFACKRKHVRKVSCMWYWNQIIFSQCFLKRESSFHRFPFQGTRGREPTKHGGGPVHLNGEDHGAEHRPQGDHDGPRAEDNLLHRRHRGVGRDHGQEKGATSGTKQVFPLSTQNTRLENKYLAENMEICSSIS